MSVSFFPTQSRASSKGVEKRSALELDLEELLDLLGEAATKLGDAFKVDELQSLSISIHRLQASLVATSGGTFEGIFVRQECQQMVESAACLFLELARNAARPQADED